tara:strand:- start:40 stop:552 length:513 start_codon:yes stop_codon:yes gene_type:complete
MDSILKLQQLQWSQLNELVSSSSREGHTFLKRMKAQYISGDNRFEALGEGVYAYLRDEQLVAICGVNKDPYLEDKNVGRLRHLYVLPTYRKKGLGRKLVEHIIKESRQHFKLLTLRTFEDQANKFCGALGFSTDTMVYSATHLYQLTPDKYLPESYLDKLQKGEYQLKYS